MLVGGATKQCRCHDFLDTEPSIVVKEQKHKAQHSSVNQGHTVRSRLKVSSEHKGLMPLMTLYVSHNRIFFYRTVTKETSGLQDLADFAPRVLERIEAMRDEIQAKIHVILMTTMDK